MSTSGNCQGVVLLSADIKKVIASSLSTLGRFHNNKYVLNQHCLESVKNIIRFLRRDNESHEIRRYLGQARVVQNDLINIIKVCLPDSEVLFDLTIRLLTTLTWPVSLLYNEEVPTEKIGMSIYMNLIELLQDYKEAFYDIDFWNVICWKLSDFFEVDKSERPEFMSLQAEKLFVLLRNVLHIPANPEREKITDNDVSVHDNIIWSLRQSRILEFLLYVSSNKDEDKYYLSILEIFSLILREQNPKILALSEVQRSTNEKDKDVQDLLALTEREKANKNKYIHTRTFDSTLVLKGLKSFSGKDMIYHGHLEDMKQWVVPKDKKRRRPRNRGRPVQSEQVERRSSFSVRIFLKEFCIEFLNCSYNNLMNFVKEKLIAGKGLENDETFYFWALKFFLEFNCAYNVDIMLISNSLNVQTFHYLQSNMDLNFEKIMTDKKKKNLWVRKLHLILKAYYSLLQTLRWMDLSKNESIRQMSSVIKSRVFYVAEYRDMALFFLTRYDSKLFSLSYLRDVIETTHIALKLLEDYSKHNKIVVRKRIRKKIGVKKKKKSTKAQKPQETQEPQEPVYESNEEKWKRIKDEVYRKLTEEMVFPDIAPFDVLLELTDEEQKERAMKNVQKMLHEEKIMLAIGLLRSARHVWPENDHFGRDGMSVEDEMMALQEICLAELGNEKVPVNVPVEKEKEKEKEKEDEEEEEEGDESEDEDFENGSVSDDGLGGSYNVSEEYFDMMSYKKQLVNKKVVKACATLLQNYAKNSDHTNHCAIKILFRIGWEYNMPAMMYQASLFWTLLTIMNDKHRNYKELNDFTVHLVRKFKEHATKNKFAFVELLFWKKPSIALEIQDELCGSSDADGGRQSTKKGRKAASWSVEEEDELLRLWGECNPEYSVGKKLEWIKMNLIDESKSLQAIKKKLKEYGLANERRRAAELDVGKEWLEEEVEELTRFFNEYRDAVDVVSLIHNRLTLKRTKKAIRKKCLELGLVSSVSQLKNRKKVGHGSNYMTYDSESCEESDKDVGIALTYSLEEQREALRKVQHMKKGLEWVRDAIQESINEDDEEVEAYPLIAVEQPHVETLKNDDFIVLLRRLGLKEPEFGEMYWKIPKNKSELKERVSLLNSAIDGELPVEKEEESEDEFEKLKKIMRRPSRKETTNTIPLKKYNMTANVRRTKNAIFERDDLVNANEDVPEPVECVLDSSDNEIARSKSRRRRPIKSDSESDTETNIITGKMNAEEEFDKLMQSHQRPADNGENNGKSAENSEEIITKRKRRNRCCISSDSDSDVNLLDKSEVTAEKTKKRMRVIDSESDADNS